MQTSVFNQKLFKILETLCNWVSNFTTSDQLSQHLGDNLSLNSPLLTQNKNNDLFQISGKEKTLKINLK